jgi:tungstate transport system permease protein
LHWRWSIRIRNGTPARRHDFIQALIDAVALVGSGDPELVQIVVLSLRVSLSASVIATVIGAPLAGTLAISRFFGRQAVMVLVNALLGLPPVVVGLTIYLLLTRSGPLALQAFYSRPSPW